MSCTSPLIAWRFVKDSLWYDKKVHPVAQGELSALGKSLIMRSNRDLKSVNPNEVEWLELPCGKCTQCRLQYSRNWADRCMLEAQEYEFNEFLTLTYAPEHLPINDDYCVPTLQPKDLTDFIKRLRQAFARGEYRVKHDDGTTELLHFEPNNNIRFFACGEYGEQYERPHYHLIIFNLKVPDKRFLFTNKQGSQNYISDLIKSIWNKGLISLCPVCWETCAYTARYVMKKQKGDSSAEYYANRGLVPEFVRMSRRPGIARKYFDDNMHKIYKYDAIWLKKGDRVEKIKPSRYYDKLYDLEYGEQMADIKASRKEKGKSIDKVINSMTSLSKVERQEQLDMISQDIVSKQLNRNYEKGTTIA